MIEQKDSGDWQYCCVLLKCCFVLPEKLQSCVRGFWLCNADFGFNWWFDHCDFVALLLEGLVFGFIEIQDLEILL